MYSIIPTDYSSITPEVRFNADVLMKHLLVLDPECFASLCHELPASAQHDKKLVCEWLRSHNSVAYSVLQSMERIWMSIWDTAYIQRESLFSLYQSQVHISEALAEFEETTPLPPRLTVEGEIDEAEELPIFFTRKDQWTEKNNVADFFEYGSRKNPTYLVNTKVWQTIYSCAGIWDMENLHAQIESKGFESVMLKAAFIPADLDMLRWKVVSNEPFFPDETRPELDRSSKRIKR